MANYGYLNHTFLGERDDRAIDAIFDLVPSDHVVMEQDWTPGEGNRPAFDKMLSALRPGDELFISSLDRLGLDAEDAVRQWRVITEEKGADIFVVDEPDLSTRENRCLTEKRLTAAARLAFAALAAGTPSLK